MGGNPIFSPPEGAKKEIFYSLNYSGAKPILFYVVNIMRRRIALNSLTMVKLAQPCNVNYIISILRASTTVFN